MQILQWCALNGLNILHLEQNFKAIDLNPISTILISIKIIVIYYVCYIDMLIYSNSMHIINKAKFIKSININKKY